MTTFYIVRDIDLDFPSDLFITLDVTKAMDFLSRLLACGDKLDEYQRVEIIVKETDDEVYEDIAWLVWVMDDEIVNVCIERYDEDSKCQGYDFEDQQCYRILARTYDDMKLKLTQLREDV